MEQIELPRHTKIKLGYSKIQGRGVFATEDIEQGELIERCPMVVLSWRLKYQHDPVIWQYCFTNTCPCEDCKKHGGHFLMVLGYGQVYNHQNDNNAHISFNFKGSVADITALKPIKKDSEVFVSYGSKYFEKRKYVSADEVAAENGSATSI